MTEEELLAYQGLEKPGAILLRSTNKRYMVVAATKLPNFTLTIPIRIPVTTSEYLNRYRYTPEYYQGSNILEQNVHLYKQGWISNEISDIIIFRNK